MIQRIQSVYLGIAALLMVAMIFLQLVNYNMADNEFVLKARGIIDMSIDRTVYATPVLLWLIIFTFLLTAANVFMYNRRIQQIKIGGGIILMLTLIIAAMVYYHGEAAERGGEAAEVTFKIPAFFPIIALILVLLANRAIRKDEKLVRSADRIR